MSSFRAFAPRRKPVAMPASADEKAEREALLKADRDFAAAAQIRGAEAWVEAFGRRTGPSRRSDRLTPSVKTASASR